MQIMPNILIVLTNIDQLEIERQPVHYLPFPGRQRSRTHRLHHVIVIILDLSEADLRGLQVFGIFWITQEYSQKAA
jgi:hypothetical protein